MRSATSLQEAISMTNRYHEPIILGLDGDLSKSANKLGILLDKSHFAFWWVAKLVLKGRKDSWTDSYTISDKESFDRLQQYCNVLNSSNEEDSCGNIYSAWKSVGLVNNWRDLVDSIKSGEFEGLYEDDINPSYTIDDKLFYSGIVEDKTPTWEEIEAVAFERFPQLKEYVYPKNNWNGYHIQCRDILKAYYENTLNSPSYKTVRAIYKLDHKEYNQIIPCNETLNPRYWEV